MVFNFKKVLADPIHGSIDITEVENKIISQTIFQRLRFIKQLGLSDFVFQGTSHSRFSHSTGVMNVVSELLSGMRINAEKYSSLKYIDSKAEILRPDSEKMLRIAGLLHDIGHFPFSHVLENTVSDICLENKYEWDGRHESLGEKIIEKTEIGEILDEEGFNKKEITGLLTSEMFSSLAKHQIISSGLDADRLDYLLRDSYYAGVSYGYYDLNRISRIILPLRDPTGVFKEAIVFHKKGIPAIEEYLIGRYNMYQQVYMHKSTVFFEEVLSKLYRILVHKEVNLLPDPDHFWKNPERLIGFIDSTIWNKILEIYEGKYKRELGDFYTEALHYSKLLIERRTYKLVWDHNFLETSKQQKGLNLQEIYERITSRLKEAIANGVLEEKDIIIPRPENESLRAVTEPPVSRPPSDIKRFFKWASREEVNIKKHLIIVDNDSKLHLLSRMDSPGIVIPMIAKMTQIYYRVFANKEAAPKVKEIIEKSTPIQKEIDDFLN